MSAVVPLFFQPFRSGLGSYLKKFAYKNASTGEFTVPPSLGCALYGVTSLQRTSGMLWRRPATNPLPR